MRAIEYRKEENDMENFIVGIVKNLSEPNKQRVADLLMGVLLAESMDKDKPQHPHGVHVQCG